jgi:hypothetical protein
MEELINVPGMNDAILKKLRDYVTVYGIDEKIYICRAQDALVQALIIAFTEESEKMEPIRYDSEELLKRVTEAVLAICPDINKMGQEIEVALGISEEPTENETGKTNQNTSSKEFAQLLKDKATIYSIVGIGSVGENEVRLRTVLDTSNTSPSSWQELYWRVE